MIRHICMFTLKEENKEQKIADFLARAEDLKSIDGLRRFEAVHNVAGTPATNYDVALIFDFDTVEDLDAYQKSPVHLEFGEFVYSIRKERACIDFEF